MHEIIGGGRKFHNEELAQILFPTKYYKNDEVELDLWGMQLCGMEKNYIQSIGRTPCRKDNTRET
jgi:hypothetical protein